MTQKITALVFAYNNSKEVIRCLESISTQSCAELIRVILHDDASTDDTLAKATEFLSSSGLSWEVISNSENQYARGIGFFRRVMSSATTPYVALCDADDYWVSKNKIEVQLREMEADPEIALTHHGFRLVHAETGVYFGASNFIDPNPNNDPLALLGSNFIGACTAMYRTSVIRSVADWGGFESLSVPDYPFWGALSIHGKVKWLDGILSAYSVSNSSMSSHLKQSGLELASFEVRRWLWFQFKSSGKVPAMDLEEAWKSLVLDWQAIPGHRLTTFKYAPRRIARGFVNHLSFERMWRAQVLLNKIRVYWSPMRRK